MKKRRTRLIREGDYLAKVDVELLITGKCWSPYLSLRDAYRLDDVRQALQRGDLKAAAHHGRIYRLMPLPD